MLQFDHNGVILMDAMFGTNDVKYHIHIDDIQFSLHGGASCLDHHRSTNMQRFGGVVGCHANKALLTYATLETIIIH
jgi:hypothetical protein